VAPGAPRYAGIALLLLILSLAPGAVYAAGKYALLIGNSDYQGAVKLKNPVNDATDMARTLKKLNFKVRLLTDASKPDIEKAVIEFIDHLRNDRGTGLFFYAGHGSQLEGDNYLIPVDATVSAEHELKHKAYNVALLLDAMKKAGNETNIIVLDACRDNPFADGFQAASRSLGESSDSRAIRPKTPKLSSGLSKLDAPPNTLVAFATAPGRVAHDGNGRNSPYTEALMKSVQREGLTVEQVFKEVRAALLEQSGGKQVPWESSSLVSDFYFKPRKSIPSGW
jgi:uncharacterized caspase-like protein